MGLPPDLQLKNLIVSLTSLTREKWSLRIGIWEASASLVYDESAEVLRIRAEVTIVAGVGGFGPQLGSRAGALVSVLHAETEL